MTWYFFGTNGKMFSNVIVIVYQWVEQWMKSNGITMVTGNSEWTKECTVQTCDMVCTDLSIAHFCIPNRHFFNFKNYCFISKIQNGNSQQRKNLYKNKSPILGAREFWRGWDYICILHILLTSQWEGTLLSVSAWWNVLGWSSWEK